MSTFPEVPDDFQAGSYQVYPRPVAGAGPDGDLPAGGVFYADLRALYDFRQARRAWIGALLAGLALDGLNDREDGVRLNR